MNLITTKRELNRNFLQDAANYRIENPIERAQFMAQMDHESDGFRALEEYADGSAYEGRKDLGNLKTGDGVRYKGRGFIMLTGGYNYEKYGIRIGVDLKNNPELASRIDVAVLVAFEYWEHQVVPRVKGKFSNTKLVTKIINGGKNGLNERKALFKRYSA